MDRTVSIAAAPKFVSLKLVGTGIDWVAPKQVDKRKTLVNFDKTVYSLYFI